MEIADWNRLEKLIHQGIINVLQDFNFVEKQEVIRKILLSVSEVFGDPCYYDITVSNVTKKSKREEEFFSPWCEDEVGKLIASAINMPNELSENNAGFWSAFLDTKNIFNRDPLEARSIFFNLMALENHDRYGLTREQLKDVQTRVKNTDYEKQSTPTSKQVFVTHLQHEEPLLGVVSTRVGDEKLNEGEFPTAGKVDTQEQSNPSLDNTLCWKTTEARATKNLNSIQKAVQNDFVHLGNPMEKLLMGVEKSCKSLDNAITIILNESTDHETPIFHSDEFINIVRRFAILSYHKMEKIQSVAEAGLNTLKMAREQVEIINTALSGLVGTNCSNLSGI